jgi:divinyl chlorophyllide a 8-vinyl-reductase
MTFTPPIDKVKPSPHPCRVVVLGATGTIGQATLRTLTRRGHEGVCFCRPGLNESAKQLAGATVRFGDVSNVGSL